jgi:GNAT superfamily N-acetyltransferase
MHSDATTADGINSEGSSVNSDAVQQDPLITVPVGSQHRLDGFACAISERVAGFFSKEAKALVPHYCRLFIAPDPNDETQVFGYYTLSAGLLLKQNLSGGDEKKITRTFMGYPAPMVRIGFMGRHDAAPKGFGAALIIDAARRVHRNGDIAAWGLVLESEGGPDNKKLWAWYQAQGFKACRGEVHAHSMYASLSAFLPELHNSN